ncbi:hypothetical protein M1D89_20195 [Arthrobacter sp. D3-18]
MTTIQEEPSPKPSRDVLMLDSAGPTATGFGLKMHAGGPQTAETLLFIADSMRSMLDEHDAPNYLEMELQASDRKQYVMTLQRKGKITPHQARVAAEEALASAQPRAVTTVEDLEALPFEAVIRDAEGHVLERWGDAEHVMWSTPGCQGFVPADVIALPVTVLYEVQP